MKTKLEDLKVGTKVIVSVNRVNHVPEIFKAIVTKEFVGSVLLEDTNKCIFEINQDILNDNEISVVVVNSIN